MIPLTTTSQSLRFTALDVSSVGLYTTAVYFDQLQQAQEARQGDGLSHISGVPTLRRATQFASTSTSTATLALSAPAAQGIVRNLELFAAYNATATTATCELTILDGAVNRFQTQQALLTKQTLVYEHGNGYQVL